MDHGVNDIHLWLTSIQLNDYAETFINRGFVNLQKCCFLNDQYLQELGIPLHLHEILLTASGQLQSSFPEYHKSDPPMANDDDTPPPLPMKKNRKSTPCPASPRRHESRLARRSYPPQNLNNSIDVIPPAAPTRKSVLKGTKLKHSDEDLRRLESNDDTVRQSASPQFLSAEDHLLNVLPPPPSSVDTEELNSEPPMIPQKNRNSSHDLDRSFSQEILLSMPEDCQEFLTLENSRNAPKEIPSVYAEISLNETNVAVSPVLPRKHKAKPPPITPRPLRADIALQESQRARTLPLSPPIISVTEEKSATIPRPPRRPAPPAPTGVVSDIAKMFHGSEPTSPPSKQFSETVTWIRKNTVKELAERIRIPINPIPSILPENKAMRFIIPHRKKIEPCVPLRKRFRTSHDASSDDTLEDSADDENRESVINVPDDYSDRHFQAGPRARLIKQNSSCQGDSEATTAANRKLRLFSDNEFKERDKKWETKSGWLWKQGGPRNNKGWKKRWFVFDVDNITYFTSNKSNSESLSCVSLCNFVEVKISHVNAESTRQKYPFELITKYRLYLLSAENSEERTLWCSILMRAITQYKPSILDDLLGGAMNNPQKAGLLKKQGNSRLKDWKSRYCAVKDGTFCYYESQEAFHIATPINSIYCGTLKAQIADRSRFKFAVIVPNRTYYFIAPNEHEMMSWIDALTNAVAEALTDLKATGGSSARELINKIYQEESNTNCADCLTADPKWASINLGIVVCNKCSGSHRKLGVHISKVRSLELDVKAWTEDMISVFHQIGNGRANDYFEKLFQPEVDYRPLPESELKDREEFIEEKYTKRKWSDVIQRPQSDMNIELMQVVQTDELHRTLALLMSGANVNYVDETVDPSKRTPYLMAVACNQRAQAQLLLLNDAAVPVVQPESEDVPDMDATIDVEGILEKRGPSSIQSYKKRKCILSGRALRYYDEHCLKNEIDLKTMIEVQMEDRENPGDDVSSDGYMFLKIRTDSRTYLFRDKDKEYVNKWYTAIRATQVFGVPLDGQPKTVNGIPVFLHKCIKFLDTRLDTEGIYRISGVKTRVDKLKLTFNQDVHDMILSDDMVTHDVSSLVKLYLRELPVSLLGTWNDQITAAVQIDDETERLYRIQDIIYELPGSVFHTLKFLIQHLYKVAEYQSVNKMGSDNLGVVFGPTLMSTFEASNDFNPYEYQAITLIIDYFAWLFQVNIETEENKDKELKLAEEELKKRMNHMDAPETGVSNSWIVEVFYNQKSVNFRIESGQKLRDVSAEIMYRTKVNRGDFALHEFLCNGELQRPIHLSEYLLNTTVTLWEERVQRSWLAIDYNDMKEKLKRFKFEPPQPKSVEQGMLYISDGKKKWREANCKITQDNMTYSKSKLSPTSLNLLNHTWYLGCESCLCPPTRYRFTLRCMSPSKDHKDDFFKSFCASDEAELWRWLFRINYVKYREPDYRLVNSKRATIQNPSNRNSYLLLEK